MKQNNDHSLDIFGFAHVPFTKSLQKPYLDESRIEIIKRLETFLRHRGFAVVSGMPGCGKTMILRHLADQLHPAANKVMYTPFSILSETDMLRALCHQMQLEPSFGKSTMLRAIQTRIQDMQPINPILVLDEMQKANHKTLEVIRILANFSFESRNFLSVIMVGSDQFIEQIGLQINEPLRQRVGLYVRLTALTREHTERYINHHFQAAGAHQEIVSKQALNLIHDTSAGIPRMINILTLAAVHAAAEKQERIIDIEHVQTAVDLVTLPTREVQQ